VRDRKFWGEGAGGINISRTTAAKENVNRGSILVWCRGHCVIGMPRNFASSDARKYLSSEMDSELQ